MSLMSKVTSIRASGLAGSDASLASSMSSASRYTLSPSG